MKWSFIEKKFGLYTRVFKYIGSYKKRIVLAIVLSALLSVTSGLATYSFLPVFGLVFLDRDVVVQENNVSTQITPVSGLLSATGLGKEAVFKVESYYERIAGAGSVFSRLIRLVIFIVVLSAISVLSAMLVDYIFITVQAGGTMRLRAATFDRLSGMPLSFFNKNKSGVLISRVENDIGGTISMVSSSLSALFQNIFLALVYFILLLIINVRLVLVVLPALFLIGVLVTLMGRWARSNRLKILVLQADITAIISEFLSGIKIIKGFAAEKIERKKWRESVIVWKRLEIINTINKVFPERLREVMTVIISGVVLIYGGQLIIKEAISVAELLLFFIVLVRFQAPLGALSNVWISVQNGMAFAQRAFELLDTPIEESDGHEHIISIDKSLMLSRVSFSYGEELVLKDVSVEILKGKMTAIVGPSGSGKSSLVDLIMRFYGTTKGDILIDGRNIKDFRLGEYRSLFGLVSQDTFLFHDTIWSNLVYGLDREVTRTDVERATKAANAHDFISGFDYGYQTVLGDRGVRLSGGQRQRIAIARAVLRNPQVLILDEATSALDTQSERQVQEAIDELINNRTTIAIAHRLSTIQTADKIIVLHEGRIIEQGVHQELLALGGLYSELWRLQSGNMDI